MSPLGRHLLTVAYVQACAFAPALMLAVLTLVI